LQLTWKPVSHLAGTTSLPQNHSRETATTETNMHYAAGDRSNSVHAKLVSDFLTCCYSVSIRKSIFFQFCS